MNGYKILEWHISCWHVDEMKKPIPLALASLGFLLGSGLAYAEDGGRPPGSFFLTAQAGLNTLVRSADFQAAPFDALPFPVGASFEYSLSRHLGLGGTVMFDQWSDYLGMFGGKWTFRLFKPSLDVTYHFWKEEPAGLDVFAGASVGYSILSVGHEVGSRYQGELKSEAHVAPFLGTNLRLRRDPAVFLGRLALTLRASWSVHGRFSGVYGAVGITYRLK